MRYNILFISGLEGREYDNRERSAHDMNFLAYENRGDSDRVKFWDVSHVKRRSGIFQIVELVSSRFPRPVFRIDASVLRKSHFSA